MKRYDRSGRLATTLAFGLTLALATATWAQRGPRFDGAPEVGETIPDVGGYTSDGEPIRLKSLDGKHRVIVFGCLT